MHHIWRVLPFALAIAACGGDSLTNPSPYPTDSGGGVSVSSSPTPSATPSPAPVGATPYAEFDKNAKDGSGTLFNPTAHAVVFTLEYFDATVFAKQKLLRTIKFEVPANSSLPVKPWAPEACGLKLSIQLDASTTTHVGHIIYSVTTAECCKEEIQTTAEIKFGEWSECKEGEGGCFSSRSVTKTITIYNPCTQERKVTTEESVETKECACACQPVIEASEVITYTEWGACEKQRDGSCAKYREKTIEIWHTNSCTGEKVLYKTNKEREFAPCECQKETCEVKNLNVQLPTGVAASTVRPNYNDPETACAFYGLTGSKYEPVSTPWISNGDYPVVIIKAGSDKSCSANENTSYFNVKYGDSLTASLCNGKDISHVIVCSCPE